MNEKKKREGRSEIGSNGQSELQGQSDRNMDTNATINTPNHPHIFTALYRLYRYVNGLCIDSSITTATSVDLLPDNRAVPCRHSCSLNSNVSPCSRWSRWRICHRPALARPACLPLSAVLSSAASTPPALNKQLSDFVFVHRQRAVAGRQLCRGGEREECVTSSALRSPPGPDPSYLMASSPPPLLLNIDPGGQVSGGRRRLQMLQMGDERGELDTCASTNSLP